MAQLIVIRSDTNQELDRWTLVEAQTYELGRKTSTPLTAGVVIRLEIDDPNKYLSRRQSLLRLQGTRLELRRFPDPVPNNPAFYRGVAVEDDPVMVEDGDQFSVVGFVFRFVANPDDATVSAHSIVEDEPNLTRTSFYSTERLSKIPFRDSNRRLESLTDLPNVILHADDLDELRHRFLEVVLNGIANCFAAALVELRTLASEVAVLSQHTHEPTSQEMRISKKLAELCSNTRQSVYHHWEDSPTDDEFTRSGESDWAICVPVGDSIAPARVLYVVGQGHVVSPDDQGADDSRRENDLKFAELAASIYSSLETLSDLRTRQALLSRFLPRPVVTLLADSKGDLDEVLQRRLVRVAVLFCDLRGACRLAEEGADDLAKTYTRVSDALDIMTKHIANAGGTIGHFQGDAAMGFWGWPNDTDAPQQYAVHTALTIHDEFARESERGSDVGTFQYGIGIATNEAIVGKLGTHDQFVVSAFGPVVNLASRLEGMSKIFGAPIIIDEETANNLESSLYCRYRLRTLGRVLPMGMTTPVTVSEVLPLATEPGALPETIRVNYENALEHFESSDWERAKNDLARRQHDGPSKFLYEYIEKNGPTPSEGWDGVIRLQSKG